MAAKAKPVDEIESVGDLIPGEEMVPLFVLIPKSAWDEIKRIAEEEGVDGMTLVSRAIAEYVEGR